MIDADPTWKEAATWLGGLLVAGLQIFGLYQVKRIGALEENKADKVDLRTLIDELRVDRASADQSRSELHEKVNDVALAVARLEGRFGRGISPKRSS